MKCQQLTDLEVNYLFKVIDVEIFATIPQSLDL